MVHHEQDRLQTNYNRIPKNIRWITDKEKDIKKELLQCIETGEEFLQASEQELKRLRREHHANTKVTDRISVTLSEI